MADYKIKKYDNLDEANARIEALEKNLDEAIALIMKRDDQIVSAERRVLDLEEKLEED